MITWVKAGKCDYYEWKKYEVDIPVPGHANVNIKVLRYASGFLEFYTKRESSYGLVLQLQLNAGDFVDSEVFDLWFSEVLHELAHWTSRKDQFVDDLRKEQHRRKMMKEQTLIAVHVADPATKQGE